jgi:hypothetical protein
MRTRRPFGRRALAAAVVAALAGTIALRGEGKEGGAAAPPPQPAPAPASPTASSPAPVEPPVAVAAQPADDGAPIDRFGSEDELLARLRAEVDVRPAVAIRLADEGEALFPDGPSADERQYVRMRALVHLGEIVAAREAAERFFVRHPQSPLARHVFRLTGMRPRPSPLPPDLAASSRGG